MGNAVRHLWGSLDIAYTLHRIITGDLKGHPDPSDKDIQHDQATSSRRYGRLLGCPDSEVHFPGYDYRHDGGSTRFGDAESPTEALLDLYAKGHCLALSLEEEGEVDLLSAQVSHLKQDGMYKFLPLLTMLYRIYEACLMMG
ncbi:hypothetical protein QFC22_002494 [Naganishia vaughanmartiniae]|uniref:Uncharacterized protein n=1 Tax=Naganishia vaughanmartiniae TaxID=1424756 RepID=A0ACC2XFR1_9TREE|nr:hypothetical protein QFC22_002494 [Naganishia vaughanmartiniae]